MKINPIYAKHTFAAILVSLTQILTHAAGVCYFDDESGCADPAPPGQPMSAATSGFWASEGTNSCNSDTNYVGYCTQSTSIPSYQTNQPAQGVTGSTHLSYSVCCTFPCEFVYDGELLDGYCVIANFPAPSKKPEHLGCGGQGNG